MRSKFVVMQTSHLFEKARVIGVRSSEEAAVSLAEKKLPPDSAGIIYDVQENEYGFFYLDENRAHEWV